MFMITMTLIIFEYIRRFVKRDVFIKSRTYLDCFYDEIRQFDQLEFSEL